MTQATDLKTSVDAIILVMGPCGAGKTSFINAASDSHLPVRDQIRSSASSIQTSNRFSLDGKQVVLAEIPAFDTPGQKDSRVFEEICKYLTSFPTGRPTPVCGVVYVHPISAADNRMHKGHILNFNVFQALCGSAFLQKTAILSNPWGNLEPARVLSYARQLEEVFQPALSAGAHYVRHSGTRQITQEETHRVIRLLIDSEAAPISLLDELVRQKMKACNTGVGKTLLCHLYEVESRELERQASIEREIEGAEAEEAQSDSASMNELLEAQQNQKMRASATKDEIVRILRLTIEVITDPRNEKTRADLRSPSVNAARAKHRRVSLRSKIANGLLRLCCCRGCEDLEN